MKSNYITITMILLIVSYNDCAVDNSKSITSRVADVVYYPITSLKASIREKYPVVQTLPEAQLKVRVGQDICPQEVTFLENRRPKVQQALKDYFDIDAPLKIGIACTGGGNRAMLASLGFLLGAQEIGLFDAAYYMVGLSGSTWTISPFSYLHATQGMTLSQFKDQLTPRLGSLMKVVVSGAAPVPVFSSYQTASMQDNFAKRYGYDQYLSSIDIYAAFIGNFTLLSAGKNRLDVTWSSIADTIQEGNIPLPLGSTVAYKKTHKQGTQYYWLEVGPFEVGSDQLQGYVPVQAFGSKFKNGKALPDYQGHTPEYPIGFYEAVFGSAFTVSVNEIVDRYTSYSFNVLGQKITLPLKQIFSSNFAEYTRFSPATFHNYTFGLPGNPMENDEKIKLYDAAMNFNIPLPIVMRPARQIDLVFVCDASIDLESLKFAQNHFKRHKIKFPDMTQLTQLMITKPLTIFNDPRLATYDKDMVTIAYCPFVKNEAFLKTFDPVVCQSQDVCNTFNFNYTQVQAEQVVGLSRYNLVSMKNEIKDVLQALQQQKTQTTVQNQKLIADVVKLNQILTEEVQIIV
jgi:Lysophospholipase catalytic domain